MKPIAFLAGLQLATLTTASALIIDLNPAVGMDPQALSGFQQAANYWQSVLTDNVTVSIDVGFSALSPGVLGNAGSSQEVFAASDVLAVLSGDATSSSDTLAIANLPSLSGLGGLSFWTQTNTEGGSTLVSFDNDDSANNRFLALNSANAKALGWIAPESYVDASITFSSSFSWDFDQSDGVGAGLQDFVGVAIHEIGHALGFVSGVDTVDYYITNPLDLDGYAIFSILDLFRYTAEGTLNLAAGVDAYFSIDGGATNLGYFSTGPDNGDGQQASHWKDNLGLGIMDPTANPAGQTNTPSELDLLTFDVIGWDRLVAIPEPSALVLAAASLLFVLRRRR